jgi:hypothetical protein
VTNIWSVPEQGVKNQKSVYGVATSCIKYCSAAPQTAVDLLRDVAPLFQGPEKKAVLFLLILGLPSL